MPRKDAIPPSSGDYTVGYGRPPSHTQFQKGQSGNQKGRPKGTLNVRTVLEARLSKKVVARENGRPIQLTTLEAIIHQLVVGASKGEPGASRRLFDLIASQRIGAAEPEAQSVVSDADDHAILARFALTLANDNTDKES